MKIAAATTLVLVASASAFAPAPSNGRVSVACDSLADRIFGMDLFAPVKEQNDYGARGKKNLKVGKLSDNSYVPAGLTKAQYEKIRGAEKKKKDDNYQRNVKKAGIFTDYTDFYLKRGTDLQGDWKKTVGLGHTFAKTAFDWSGTDDAKKFESSNLIKKGKPAAKKAPVKKAAAKKWF